MSLKTGNRVQTNQLIYIHECKWFMQILLVVWVKETHKNHPNDLSSSHPWNALNKPDIFTKDKLLPFYSSIHLFLTAFSLGNLCRESCLSLFCVIPLILSLFCVGVTSSTQYMWASLQSLTSTYTPSCYLSADSSNSPTSITINLDLFFSITKTCQSFLNSTHWTHHIIGNFISILYI